MPDGGGRGEDTHIGITGERGAERNAKVISKVKL